MNRESTPARPTTKAVLSLSAIALLITGGLLYAGPLNPPAGPVTSTYKTLTEVEPRTAVNATNTPGNANSLFKITQPGSYYLTGNITGVVGKHGVEITASGVTLDLSGFDLAGVPAMGAFDGVSVTVGGLTNITVVNGSARNWGKDGINVGEFSVTGGHIEGVQASGNVRVGLYAGINTVVSKCSGSGGQYGIYAGPNCAVSDCTATDASSLGIFADNGSAVAHCSAYSNTGTGITTSTGCTVTNCSAYFNTGSGFNTGAGNTVTNCTAVSNGSIGIIATFGSTIEGCTARANTLDGILCSSGCIIRANTCNASGVGDGAGIHATGADNRIEGNNCVGADRGIDVDVAGNIIIRNTCSGNATDWVIVANNVVGPILDRRAPASAAINGFSFVGSLGTTDPNANFSY